MLTDAQTDDGRKVITIAHPEQSSGELIRNKKGVLLAYQSVKNSLQQQMHFKASIFGNKCCHCNEDSVFSIPPLRWIYDCYSIQVDKFIMNTSEQ